MRFRPSEDARIGERDPTAAAAAPPSLISGDFRSLAGAATAGGESLEGPWSASFPLGSFALSFLMKVCRKDLRPLERLSPDDWTFFFSDLGEPRVGVLGLLDPSVLDESDFLEEKNRPLNTISPPPPPPPPVTFPLTFQMSTHFSVCAQANLRATLHPPHPPRRSRRLRCSPPSASRGDSYLDMWKKAMERERKSQELRWIAAEPEPVAESSESLNRKTERFNRILQFPRADRDRIQRLQVIDRAAAAIAAARALLKEYPPTSKPPPAVGSDGGGTTSARDLGGAAPVTVQQGLWNGNSSVSQSGTSGHGTPGPDFWSWSPPLVSKNKSKDDVIGLQPIKKLNSHPNLSSSLMEKEQSADFLQIPFETFESKHNPPLPPLQSIMEVEKVVDTNTSASVLSTTADENKLGLLFSRHAEEAAEALGMSDVASSHGVSPDGSKWWRETGIDQRTDGVVCKWTLTRGVSADQTVEWEDKFWEASDRFDYKELGSEKSGRDATGNVWREYWKESMWQDLSSGLMHIEKSADKWGKNGRGGEWHEKWWEHYDASGQAEKWADKWCSIDPNTRLDAGHAHVWHERWGEKYDGKGGSMKYTDKWAERSEGDYGWSKWGDKWDENMGPDGHGVKQGETWWAGPCGERWGRTWGERHNGSGWVHKYGRSSCGGEHWDTHVQQETWYERYPHFGFDLCVDNSVQLRAVRKQPPPPAYS